MHTLSLMYNHQFKNTFATHDWKLLVATDNGSIEYLSEMIKVLLA
jgi:hypothetical protein